MWYPMWYKEKERQQHLLVSCPQMKAGASAGLNIMTEVRGSAPCLIEMVEQSSHVEILTKVGCLQVVVFVS